jgi:hypothetical protein
MTAASKGGVNEERACFALLEFHKSDVQLPIPPEGSLLDLLLAKQKVQRRTDFIPALSKLCRQIILAHHHLPGRVAAMNAACIV